MTRLAFGISCYILDKHGIVEFWHDTKACARKKKSEVDTKTLYCKINLLLWGLKNDYNLDMLYHQDKTDGP